ncbi:MAG: hypothetical protein U5S82_02245 [Gammaproteobacteria bacterium]|nr:hypothetical protein [Gammaproteobacteria bacterium]
MADDGVVRGGPVAFGRSRWWLALFGILVLALPWAGVAAERPVLTGVWVLDEGVEAVAGERLKEALEARSSRPRRGGKAGEGRDGTAPPVVPGLPRAIHQTLDIVHEEPRIRITPGDGQMEHLFTDYRGASVSARGASQVVATAGWEGDALVVESHLRGGMRMLRRYRLDPQDDSLSMTLELSGRWWPEPVSIPLRYQQATATAAAEAGRK